MSSTDREEPLPIPSMPKSLFSYDVCDLLFEANPEDDILLNEGYLRDNSSSYASDMDIESLDLDSEGARPLTETTESLCANSEEMDQTTIEHLGGPEMVGSHEEGPSRPRIYTANEVRIFITSSHSEESSSSSSDEDSVYDLSNPEVGAHDSNGSELYDLAADLDVGVQLDPVRESELSSNDEQNAASYVLAKEKANQKNKDKADPKTKKKADQKAKEKVDTKAEKKKEEEQKKKEPPLPSYDIDVPDKVYGTKIPFTPTRSVGIHLPPNTTDKSPKGFFQLFFTEDIVADICRCSDEYAEDTKSKNPYLYKHYKSMSSEDFLKFVGLLIHFEYHKIPQYRLVWRRTSLCFDPFVAATMSRNRFDSLMSMLHVVDKATEQDLKKKGDKLAKVSLVVCICMNTRTCVIL